MLLKLLIAQVLMILINESMKIKRQFRRDIIKQRVASEIMLETILVLGLTPSDSDCLQHNQLPNVPNTFKREGWV